MNTIDPKDIRPGQHWLTVQLLGSGWAAVEMWLNNEDPRLGDFPEPWDTGVGRYRDRFEAEVEALQWSEGDELPIQKGHIQGDHA